MERMKSLIVKYLTNEISSTELDILNEWIENSDHENIFDNYVKIHYEVTATMEKPDVDSIKENLLKRMRRDKYPLKNSYVFKALKYAAILLLVFGLGYLYQDFNSMESPKMVQKIRLIPQEEPITLQLDNGIAQSLDPNEEREIRNSNGKLVANQTNGQLAYVGYEEGDLIYNTINVPKGKRFDIILSDGTHVYMNSGTILRFPVTFIGGLPRSVFLDGEAYFDVEEDRDHPFIVHTGGMNVEVLGTKFNVSNYAENENIQTVLVQGSIKLGDDGNTKEKSVVLKPGFKADWNKQEGNIVALEHVDTRIFTAWMDGKLVFRNATFKQIRHTLERHYGVVIKNQNIHLDEQRFDATFDIETIDEILETFSLSYAIDYSIIDNQAIIH